MGSAFFDDEPADGNSADWHRRVVGRSLSTAQRRSIDRGARLIRAAATLLERSDGDGFTVQDVADEAGQSLRTLYQYFESKDDLLLAVFEEAMGLYAQMLRQAVAELEDPLERLAGAMLAAVHMPEFSSPGLDRGLARLRLKLGEVEPELVSRSQVALAEVFGELIREAESAGGIARADPQESTFTLLALQASYITSKMLGNDFGVHPPSSHGLTMFCLRGLGADVDDEWLDSVEGKVRMPSGRFSLDSTDGDRKPAGARSKAAPAKRSTAKRAPAKRAPARSSASRRAGGGAPARKTGSRKPAAG